MILPLNEMLFTGKRRRGRGEGATEAWRGEGATEAWQECRGYRVGLSTGSETVFQCRSLNLVCLFFTLDKEIYFTFAILRAGCTEKDLRYLFR